MDDPAKQANGDMCASIKFAMAMAIIESRRRQKLPSSSTTTQASESDAIRWKIKAKERKEEIRKLKEDLKMAEGKDHEVSDVLEQDYEFTCAFLVIDGVHHDLFPQNVSCKCYFYDNLGQLSPNSESDQKRINDVLRRRFLRQVRLSERKRRRLDNSSVESCISDSAVENKMEQLRTSVDFLVELCETSAPNRVEESNFKNWSHQAVDFILATLKALSQGGKIEETTESIVNSLIVRLVRRMCNGPQEDELVQCDNSLEFNVQHLMRKLGSDPYIGQRVILSVSQRISMAAESLLFMDPFNGAFPKMHNSMYTMIQLIEFLISDYLMPWSTRQDVDSKLLEEWVISVFHARKALELLESRNALYILYMDRVIGNLTRHLGQVPFVHMLQPDALDRLFG